MIWFMSIDQLLKRAELVVAAIALVVIVGATATGVISRSVFGAPVIWTSELALLAQIWLTFIGAAAVYKERGHIGITGVIEALPRPVARLLSILLNGASAVLLIIVGMTLATLMDRQWEQAMSTLGIPRAFTSLPVVWAMFSISASAVFAMIVGDPKSSAGKESST